MNVHHASFAGVNGYATHANAHARGEEVAATKRHLSYRWVVISLPNGRFAPCAIINGSVPGGPGEFLGLRNFCLVN